MRAEQLSQKGWFVAFALEHNFLVVFWGEPSGSLIISVRARATGIVG